MALEEKIESVKKVASKGSNPAAEFVEEQERMSPNKEHFDSLMTKQAPTDPSTQAKAVEQVEKPSLIEHISETHQKESYLGQKVAPTELVAQTQEAITQIKTIKEKLQSPNVEIKSSTQNLLQNKLTHINDTLQVALSKAGSEFKTEAPTTQKPANPIERFLGFLSDGQSQLETLGQEIQQWHLRQGEISPATMLAVQIKVGYVQQELEFFTSLLNKALESTKTIMNVQV